MRNQGFTFVELITVIIILGILAVYVAPRFLSSTEGDTMSAEVYLTSQLRLQQQRAMQDTANVGQYGVRMQTDSNVIAIEAFGPADIEATSSAGMEFADIGYAGPEEIVFNGLGCVEQCGGLALQLELVGRERALLCINPQGYIRTGQCE